MSAYKVYRANVSALVSTYLSDAAEYQHAADYAAQRAMYYVAMYSDCRAEYFRDMANFYQDVSAFRYKMVREYLAQAMKWM